MPDSFLKALIVFAIFGATVSILDSAVGKRKQDEVEVLRTESAVLKDRLGRLEAELASTKQRCRPER